jgi:hypothetical protein
MVEFQGLGDPIDLDEIVASDGDDDGTSAEQPVIDAASGGDVAALRGFVRGTPTACVTVVDGIGGPPECRDGEAPGMEVNVVLVADCEGHMDRVEELALPFYEDGVEFADAYAIPDSFNIVGGDTMLVFRSALPDGEELGIAIVMDGGAITGFYNGCGQTVAQLVIGLELGEPIASDPGT